MTRPAAPEPETPETDAATADAATVGGIPSMYGYMVEHARSLEHRLSLAQTEIKGHMRIAKEVRMDALEEAAEICQRLSDKLRKSAYNARGDQPKWRSLHRKRNGVIACIAAIRTLKSRA